MSLKIRKAMRNDAATIARVHVETWRSAYAGSVPNRYLLELSSEVEAVRWQRRIGQARSRETTLVAEVPSPTSSLLVGFVSGGPARRHSPPAKAEVYTLYVLDDYQNLGIGRALLTGLLRDLLARGYNDAFLWVLADNPARFFYQAMGGQAAGQQEEAFAGAKLKEEAYIWPDLVSWLIEDASDGDGRV